MFYVRIGEVKKKKKTKGFHNFSLSFYHTVLIFIFYPIPSYFYSQMKYNQFVRVMKTEDSLNCCYDIFLLNELNQILDFISHLPVRLLLYLQYFMLLAGRGTSACHRSLVYHPL